MRLIAIFSLICLPIWASALNLLPAEACLSELEKIGKFATITSSYHKAQIPVRYGVFTPHNPKSTLVYLTSRAEHIERYCDVIQYFYAKDINIVVVEWLGNGLSGRLAKPYTKGHIDNYDTYIKDLGIIMPLLQKMPKPINLAAFSMGGNIGLRFLIANPMAVEKAIFISPIWDTDTNPALIVSSRAMMAFVGKEAFLPGNAPYEKLPMKDYIDVSLNEERIMRNQKLYDINPNLAVGGYTYGFADATINSIEKLHGEIEKNTLQIPILILGNLNDKVASPRGFKDMMAKLPSAKFINYEGAKHALLMERDAIADNALNDIMDFIK